jgi:hypothetical protein
MCDNQGMLARALGAGAAQVVSGSSIATALLLGGCATQQQTAQALTIAGAAAVIVGASMAADSDCYNPGEGAVEPYCNPRLSKGARNVGKGVAVAGVGLAAAGYALTPRGPDRMRQARSDPPVASSSPYRLIRHEPPPEATAPNPADPNPADPDPADAVPPDAVPPGAEPVVLEPPAACRPEGSAAPAGEPCTVQQPAPPVAPASGAAP